MPPIIRSGGIYKFFLEKYTLNLSFRKHLLLLYNSLNRFNHTSWMAVVTQIDRPKSVCNRRFSGVFVLCLDCFISDGIGAFVIGLCQISSVFSLSKRIYTQHIFIKSTLS